MLVLVAGAGLIGFPIIKMLIKHKHDVVVIDTDLKVCNTIYEETGAMTVNGSATDIKVLEESGAKKADVLLCLLRRDADNISCALFGRSFGIAKIIGYVRKPRYEQAYKFAGTTSIISMTDLLLNTAIMEIENPEVKKIFTIKNGDVALYAIRIPSNAKLLGKNIKEVISGKKIFKDIAFMGILEKSTNNFTLSQDHKILGAGDTVFLVSKDEQINQVADFITKVKYIKPKENKKLDEPNK